MVLHEAPATPADWSVANRLPAGTAPANDAIHVAAHDPAAIPLGVKPRAGSIAAEPTSAAVAAAPQQDAVQIGPPVKKNTKQTL